MFIPEDTYRTRYIALLGVLRTFLEEYCVQLLIRFFVRRICRQLLKAPWFQKLNSETLTPSCDYITRSQVLAHIKEQRSSNLKALSSERARAFLLHVALCRLIVLRVVSNYSTVDCGAYEKT